MPFRKDHNSLGFVFADYENERHAQWTFPVDEVKLYDDPRFLYMIWGDIDTVVELLRGWGARISDCGV